MKTVKTRPQHSILNVRGLIFIYILLCILTVLFSRSFFTETLYEGKVPGRLNLVVFFTIPAVLLFFLSVSAVGFLGDVIARRPGVKFKTRLLAYFFVTVVFAAAPLFIVTGMSINEIIRFWRSMEADAAKTAAQIFAVDNYRFHNAHLDTILKTTNWNAVMSPSRGAGAAALPAALPADIASVQDFRRTEGGWEEAAYVSGAIIAADMAADRLDAPPSETEGYVTRELPRDTDLIRYVSLPSRTLVRVINYHLGDGFDEGRAVIEKQGERFDVIDILLDNARILMLFYFGVFFVPTLLMTAIIAISFTRRVTNPIVELTEATRRVAEGDFSIQILARRGDELGLLIRSFNAMVQDLEK